MRWFHGLVLAVAACASTPHDTAYTMTYVRNANVVARLARKAATEHAYVIAKRRTTAANLDGDGYQNAFITMPVILGADEVALVVQVVERDNTLTRHAMTITVTPRVMRDGRMLSTDEIPAAARSQAEALLTEIRKATEPYQAPM